MATKVAKRRAGAPKANASVPPAILADPSAPEPVATDLAALVASVPASPEAAPSVTEASAAVLAETQAVAEQAAEATDEALAELQETTSETVELAASVPADVIETTETAEAVTPPAAASTADTVQKEMHTMATAFEAPKYDAPKMFADMNERAKAAFEKSGKMVQEMGEFGKGNVEAIVESSRIAAKGFEAMGQDAADYSRRSFEGLTATMKNMASVKSPADFFKLQSDYIRGAFDAAVAEASKNTEAMIKLAGDAAQPISSRVALAVDKVKTAA